MRWLSGAGPAFLCRTVTRPSSSSCQQLPHFRTTAKSYALDSPKRRHACPASRCEHGTRQVRIYVQPTSPHAPATRRESPRLSAPRRSLRLHSFRWVWNPLHHPTGPCDALLTSGTRSTAPPLSVVSGASRRTRQDANVPAPDDSPSWNAISASAGAQEPATGATDRSCKPLSIHEFG